MTPAAKATEPLTVFGDLEQDVWGFAIGETPEHWMVASFDGGPLATVEPFSVRETDASTRSADADDVLQLVSVEGEVTSGTDGALQQRHVKLAGIQMSAVSAEKLGSLRLLGIWMPTGYQLAVSARRPKGAAGQDRDDIQALAAGEEWEHVVDPRLSATYNGNDVTRRIGVELWLERKEDDNQRARRFAGEATGASLSAAAGSVSLEANALRCWSGVDSGAGVYVTLRPDKS